MRYEDLPEEQRPIAGAEDFRDFHREEGHETDGPIEKAARKYLKVRNRRIQIEFESGYRSDAILYRLAELFRARRFAKLAQIEIENRQNMDNMLPTLARITLDEPDIQELH